MGFDTKNKEAKSPFQRAKSPSVWIKSFPAFNKGSLFSACFVLRTQNGFVAIAEKHPAEPEHFEILKKEFGSNPKIFFTLAYATK